MSDPSSEHTPPPSYPPSEYAPPPSYPPSSEYAPPASYPASEYAAPTSYPPPTYPPPTYSPATYPPNAGQSGYPPGPGQLGYAQPGSAQSYPPPGYPGAYGAYPPGAPGMWGEQPPARKRSRKTIVAVAVAAVVVVGGGVAAALVATSGGSTSASRISAPDTISDYRHLDNATSQRAASVMRDMTGNSGPAAQFFDNATIAAYGADSGDRPNLLVVMLPTKALPSGYSAGQDTVDQLLSMTVQNPSNFPAGSHGGALSCGSTGFGTVQETMCAWSDQSTTGLMVSVSPARQPAEVAATANTLRDEIDR